MADFLRESGAISRARRGDPQGGTAPAHAPARHACRQERAVEIGALARHPEPVEKEEQEVPAGTAAASGGISEVAAEFERVVAHRLDRGNRVGLPQEGQGLERLDGRGRRKVEAIAAVADAVKPQAERPRFDELERPLEPPARTPPAAGKTRPDPRANEEAAPRLLSGNQEVQGL